MAMASLVRGLLPRGPAIRGQLIIKASPRVIQIEKKRLHLCGVQKAREYGPNEIHISKTSHWMSEKVLSLAMVPIIPVAIVYPTLVTDIALSITVVLHTHWGLASVITDYVHGPVLPKTMKFALLLASILSLGSLSYLSYYDCGLGKGIHMIFTQL